MHGGSVADAFDIVIPSLPGYGPLRQADRCSRGDPYSVRNFARGANSASEQSGNRYKGIGNTIVQ